MFALGKLLHMVTCILPCIAFKLSLKMFNTSISENEKKIYRKLHVRKCYQIPVFPGTELI